jgi:hypothetical protein
MRIHRSASAIAAFLLIPAYFISAQIINPQTPLKARMESNIIIAKLEDGDSLFSKIAQISRKYGI